MVHPALHEAFGISCLEALAAGRPVICLNCGGPALQVTPEVGFVVEPGPVEETVFGRYRHGHAGQARGNSGAR